MAGHRKHVQLLLVISTDCKDTQEIKRRVSHIECNVSVY